MRKKLHKMWKTAQFCQSCVKKHKWPKTFVVFFWFRNNAFMVMACLWQNQQFFIEEDPTYICYVYIIY